MRIALVCPSNMVYMPYIGNYKKILEETGVDYDIINWDRFSIEEESEIVFKDTKIGHRRGFLDYYKYSKFVLNILKNNNYDKIIIFGIQLVFFIERFLIREYSNKFIIDIRDRHGIIKFFNIKKAIDNSAFTVLSSPGFKEWLPKSNRYIINHNTKALKLEATNDEVLVKERIILSYIGAIRDYDVNIQLINDLDISKRIKLEYHGEGIVNAELCAYIERNHIKNVEITGRYTSEIEDDFYKKSDIINILIPDTDINSKTLLTNRLYQAVVFGKPILTNKGSYQATVIKKYNLGIVIDSIDNVEKKIMEYFNDFDMKVFNFGRESFFEKVMKENGQYEIKLRDFFEEY